MIVRAEREVILCGGAYHSPQLLMLSGGRARPSVLTAYGMEVLLDQPEVGANLQDHAQVAFTWNGDEPVSLAQCRDAGGARGVRDRTAPGR